MEGSEEVVGGCDGRVGFQNSGGGSSQRGFGERAWERYLVCSFDRRLTLLTFYPVLLSNSGSVRIDDVEYRWKTKGTGSKIVVRYCRKGSYMSNIPSLARQQSHWRDSRSVPQQDSKQFLSETSGHESRDLRCDLTRSGCRVADIHSCVEGTAERETGGYACLP